MKNNTWLIVFCSIILLVVAYIERLTIIRFFHKPQYVSKVDKDGHLYQIIN